MSVLEEDDLGGHDNDDSQDGEGTNTRQYWWLCHCPLREWWQGVMAGPGGHLRSPVSSPRDSLRVTSAFDQPLLTRAGPNTAHREHSSLGPPCEGGLNWQSLASLGAVLSLA